MVLNRQVNTTSFASLNYDERPDLSFVSAAPTSNLPAHSFSASALQALARGRSRLMLSERSILKVESAVLHVSLVLVPA